MKPKRTGTRFVWVSLEEIFDPKRARAKEREKETNDRSKFPSSFNNGVTLLKTDPEILNLSRVPHLDSVGTASRSGKSALFERR